jgi:micrococcal nuclease
MYQKIIFLFAVFIFSVPANGQQKGKNVGKAANYQVTRIVDGDTFWADDGSGKVLKVRLIGVDAPETQNRRNKVKAVFGTESTEYLTNLINGKMVRLECDIDSLDQYGRTLSYVFLEDGTFVNASLIRDGYAMVMTIPPNVKYADTFVDLARKAKKHKRGLWGE